MALRTVFAVAVAALALVSVTRAGALTATAVADPGTPLRPSTPMRGHVADARYAYYRVMNADLEFPTTIQVSPMSGDSDLYVGCSTGSTASDYPSQARPDSWKWGSFSAGSADDEVRIARTGPKSWSGQGCAPADDVLISVWGYTNSTFEIQVTEGLEPQELFDALPVQDTVAVHAVHQYTFDDADGGDVQFTLNSLAGDGDLYANCHGDGPPSNTNYKWSSQNAGSSDDVINIGSSDDAFCRGAGAGFQVGVYGFAGVPYADDDAPGWALRGGSGARVTNTTTMYAHYVVTATASSGPAPDLTNEAVQFGSVRKGTFQFFDYPSVDLIDHNSGVFFALTPQYGGAPTLYTSCSNKPRPTVAQYDRKSTAAGDAPKIIAYEPVDADFCDDGRSFQLGVYGSTDAVFSLVAVRTAASAYQYGKVIIPGGTKVSGTFSPTGNPQYFLYNIDGSSDPTLALRLTNWGGAETNDDATVNALVAFQHGGRDHMLRIPSVSDNDGTLSAAQAVTKTLAFNSTAPARAGAWGLVIVVNRGALSSARTDYTLYVDNGSNVVAKHVEQMRKLDALHLQ